MFAGSENNMINVWNAYTGKLIASYYPYKNHSTTSIAIHCIDFHPTDNIICVSHYGRKLPLLLYKFDKSIKTNDVNIKLYEIDTNTSEVPSHKIEATKRIKSEKLLDFKQILEKMEKVTVTD